MPIRELLAEVEAVTDEEIRELEEKHLIEASDGEEIGVVTDPFIKKLLVLTERATELWDSMYEDIDLSTLTAGEDVRERIADYRARTLQGILDHCLRMQCLHSIRFVSWHNGEMGLEVRKDWKIWIYGDISAEEVQEALDESDQAAKTPAVRH